MGIIRKAIVGMANAGVPMLMEQWRTQVQEQKDSKLHKYAMELQSTALDAKSQEAAKDRDQRRGEIAADLDLRRQEVAMRGEAHDANIRAANLALEDAQLNMDDKRRIRDLRTILVNPSSADGDKTIAAEELGLLLGEGSEGLKAITVYGEMNDFGQQPRYTALLSPTGEVRPVSLSRPNAAEPDSSPTSSEGRTSQASPGRSLLERLVGGIPSRDATPVTAEGPKQQDSDSGAGQAIGTAADDSVLAGYTLPATDIFQQARASSAEAREFNAQQRLNEAAEDIAEVLETRDLRKLARWDYRRKIDDAIKSGKLSGEQAAVLQAVKRKLEY